MYTKDDQQTAKVADRIIAGVISGGCGYFFGVLLAVIAFSFLGNDYGLKWVVAILFASFGFIAPSRSRDLWSAFWSGILSMLRGVHR